MLYFFSFWYGQSAPWMYARYQNAYLFLEETFAVRSTLAHLGEPLFQDYTLQGKVIGFGLRIARAGFGYLLYGLVALAFFIALVLWWLLPVFAIVVLIGGFIAPHPGIVPPTSVTGGLQ